MPTRVDAANRRAPRPQPRGPRVRCRLRRCDPAGVKPGDAFVALVAVICGGIL